VSGRDPDAIEDFVQRVRQLVGAGLRTPPVRYDAVANEFVSPWIHGETGRAALRGCLGEDAADASRATDSFLDAALAPLVVLHNLRACELSLRLLDPWRRIDPRLDPREGSWLDPARRLRAALATDLGAALAGAEARVVPVHGDFHAGQLILDAADDSAWLLDLDDLAAGPVESDLANFAAHVVTSEDLHRGEVPGPFAVLVRRLAARYQRLASRSCDEDLLRYYGAAALLRRALKLHGRGLGRPRVQALFEACAQLHEAPLPGP
jgi:hypothetical protein